MSAGYHGKMTGRNCPEGRSRELSRENVPGSNNVQGNVYWKVWMLMQDYKSLHLVVMICDSLVNTQTHRQSF